MGQCLLAELLEESGTQRFMAGCGDTGERCCAVEPSMGSQEQLPDDIPLIVQFQFFGVRVRGD